MRNAFKMFLVPILLLSAIGAVAQTVAAKGQAGSAQENGTATATTISAARLNAPAQLFVSHLQSGGLLDRAVMRAIANLAPTHAVPTSTESALCSPACASGLKCCVCTDPPSCITQAECNNFC